MSESTARADRFGVSSSPSSQTPPPGYLWEVANKPISVRISLDTVDRLEREVVESFRSLSSRGSEVGGLLLGSILHGMPARVSIEGYELVPCDYVRGPLYQFAEPDAERFHRAAELRNAAGPLRVVGYFRSHTRKGLGLDAEDIAFFSGHFRDPQHVALLIRPYASKPSTAGLFIWENGAIRGEASYQEFPFRRSELERMPQPESKPPAEKPSVEMAAPPADPGLPKPSARGQIVPIASRREIATPPPPPERPAAPPRLPERPPLRPDVRPEPAAERPAPFRFTERPPAPEPAASKPQPPKPEAPPKPAAPPKLAPEFEKPHETAELAELILPPLERPRRGSKMIWISAGSAAALLALSGALIFPGLAHKGKAAGAPAAAAVSPALSLRVERAAGELMLTWNRDAAPIKNAARGVLAINDGDQHENVNLDVPQLRNGSVVYSPTGSDVSFQLSIIGADSVQTSSESVRILKTRPSPLTDNQPAAPQTSSKPAPPQRTEAASLTTPPATALVASAAAPPTPAAAAAQSAQASENKPKASNVREFRADSLSQRLRPARPADLPEAPGFTASAAAPLPVAVPGLNSIPGLPVPPAARPAAPKAGPTQGGQLQQAQLISSKPPDYPLVAKQAHVQGVVVVSAIVGVDGKVKSATAVSGPPLLQRAAVDAVRQWMYKPTTLNGAPVESETRVEVRFTNSH